MIRPERVRVEAHGSAGPNRVPALVDRLVYLGAATQVILRLATGESLQAVVPNEDAAAWSQGTPVHAFLAADALRVLAGDAAPAPADADAAGQLGAGWPAYRTGLAGAFAAANAALTRRGGMPGSRTGYR